MFEIVAQPCQGGVEVGQLGAEPLGRDGGVQPGVARDGAAGEDLGRCRPDIEQVRVQGKGGHGEARQLHPVGVLAAAAVQDPADVALKREPDELGGIGGQRGRG